MPEEKLEFKVESKNPILAPVIDDLIKAAHEQASITLEGWLGKRFPKEAYVALRKRTDASRAGDEAQVERYENDFFILTGLSWRDLGVEIEEQKRHIHKLVQKALEGQVNEIERETKEADGSDTSPESVPS